MLIDGGSTCWIQTEGGADAVTDEAAGHVLTSAILQLTNRQYAPSMLNRAYGNGTDRT